MLRKSSNKRLERVQAWERGFARIAKLRNRRPYKLKNLFQKLSILLFNCVWFLSINIADTQRCQLYQCVQTSTRFKWCLLFGDGKDQANPKILSTTQKDTRKLNLLLGGRQNWARARCFRQCYAAGSVDSTSTDSTSATSASRLFWWLPDDSDWLQVGSGCFHWRRSSSSTQRSICEATHWGCRSRNCLVAWSLPVCHLWVSSCHSRGGVGQEMVEIRQVTSAEIPTNPGVYSCNQLSTNFKWLIINLINQPVVRCWGTGRGKVSWWRTRGADHVLKRNRLSFKFYFRANFSETLTNLAFTGEGRAEFLGEALGRWVGRLELQVTRRSFICMFIWCLHSTFMRWCAIQSRIWAPWWRITIVLQHTLYKDGRNPT